MQPHRSETNGLAITSMVLGILGFVTGVTAIPAVIFGHIALGQIRREPDQEGRGMAIAGLVCGYVMIGLMLLFVAGLIIIVLAWNDPVR